MVQKSKGCHNEGIILSLQEVIKRPLKDIIPFTGIGICFADRINFLLGTSTCNQSLCQSTRFSSAQSLISDKLITMDI